MSRTALSKKVRFEVFKRDGFKCQYCGRHPPDVVLEADHIISVRDGGTDDIENLITACFDCNRGKGPDDLSSGSMNCLTSMKCWKRLRSRLPRCRTRNRGGSDTSAAFAGTESGIKSHERKGSNELVLE